jgi:hypothetical protein
LGNKKAPDLFRRGFGSMMRPFDYARTTPETREGFPALVVVFVVVIMRAAP